MTQRTGAGILAIVATALLWAWIFTTGVPYVVYSPGVTVNVLGDYEGKDIIDVKGHEIYHEAADVQGQLRMTTVYVTQPQAKVNLFEATGAWLNRDQAIYPYHAIYRPEETKEDSRAESAIQMVSSQDAATAAALDELGYSVTPITEVLSVAPDSPAEDVFKVRDVLVKVDGVEITKAEDVVAAVDKAPADSDLEFVIKRDGQEKTVSVSPTMIDGDKRIGLTAGPGFVFPFDVRVAIDPNIGGPSAGLMFSLGIYDILTPGSLTDSHIVAGTGTINEFGQVGPIGGIQQKIVAARDAKAGLFLVPAGNCGDLEGVPNGDMRLAKVETMHDAVTAIEDWAADPEAKLTTCQGGDNATR